MDEVALRCIRIGLSNKEGQKKCRTHIFYHEATKTTPVKGRGCQYKQANSLRDNQALLRYGKTYYSIARTSDLKELPWSKISWATRSSTRVHYVTAKEAMGEIWRMITPCSREVTRSNSKVERHVWIRQRRHLHVEPIESLSRVSEQTAMENAQSSFLLGVCEGACGGKCGYANGEK